MGHVALIPFKSKGNEHCRILFIKKKKGNLYRFPFFNSLTAKSAALAVNAI